MRQTHSICSECINRLSLDQPSRTCITCGQLNLTWLCKGCKKNPWAFDETIVMAHDTNRLFSILMAVQRGNLQHLSALVEAWSISCKRKMGPVDVLIPFPESQQACQKRGFWFALEFAKKLQAWNHAKIKPSRSLELPLHNLRVAIVLPYMQWTYPVQELALCLRSLGARWITNWVLIRQSKKEHD
jgi:predicted amidophosphoribosyltransferase